MNPTPGDVIQWDGDIAVVADAEQTRAGLWVIWVRYSDGSTESVLLHRNEFAINREVAS